MITTTSIDLKVLLGACRREQNADLLSFSPIEQQQKKEKKREKTVTQQYQRSLSSSQLIVTLAKKEDPLKERKRESGGRNKRWTRSDIERQVLSID
jgi:hypothetical protein